MQQDVPCLPDLDPHGPNPHLPVLTATAIAWSAAMRAVIATGAVDGDGAIGMMVREVRTRAGVAAGAGTVVTDMARAFGSGAVIRASGYDVTRTSRCEPA